MRTNFMPGNRILNRFPLIHASVALGLVLHLTIAGFAGAQDVEFGFGAGMGGTDDENGKDIVVDSLGNVYTTGSFEGTVDFDPGDGISNLTSAGKDDIFVSKLDASGDFVWAKSMGGFEDDVGYGIAVDAAGNVYTVGAYEDMVDFDPGEEVYNLISVDSDDIFVSKLDASGDFVWVKSMGDASADIGHSIAVDASGNVYTTALLS